MIKVIKIVSCLIILLGMVHVSFAFPLHLNTETLWFAGAGMAIIFSGLLNLVAVEKGRSKFSMSVGIVVNVTNLAMFSFALIILKEPQVYAGLFAFLITSVAFILLIKKQE